MDLLLYRTLQVLSCMGCDAIVVISDNLPNFVLAKTSLSHNIGVNSQGVTFLRKGGERSDTFWSHPKTITDFIRTSVHAFPEDAASWADNSVLLLHVAWFAKQRLPLWRQKRPALLSHIIRQQGSLYRLKVYENPNDNTWIVEQQRGPSGNQVLGRLDTCDKATSFCYALILGEGGRPQCWKGSQFIAIHVDNTKGVYTFWFTTGPEQCPIPRGDGEKLAKVWELIRKAAGSIPPPLP